MSADNVRPTHRWNDPDGEVSQWKCDRWAHLAATGPYGLLDDAERQELFRELEEGARERRASAASARSIPLP